MPRLTYSGDTTNLFGRFLPTPVFDGIKITNVASNDQEVLDAIDRGLLQLAISEGDAATDLGTLGDVNYSNMARIEVNTSLIFNSDDSFNPEEYFNTLLTNGVDNVPSLYLNIIAIKESTLDQNLIRALKEDKLQISNLRSALDSIQGTVDSYGDDSSILTPSAMESDLIVNQFLNKTAFQAYSIPYSSVVSDYEFRSDYDDDGNPFFSTGNQTFKFIIGDFRQLKNVSIFACLSTRSIHDISLQSRAMFALNFGDISYEDIVIGGKVAKFGDPVFIDSQSLVYTKMPLMALNSKFYKTDSITKLDLDKSLDPIITKYSKFINNDKSLKRQINNILFVRQKYSESTELLPNLQKSNNLSPSKSPNNNIGRMYDEIRISINNFNVGLQGEEEVVKRIFRNFKILDLRDVVNLEFATSYDENNDLEVFEGRNVDENYIYMNKIHSNAAKYVPINDAMNWPGRAEIPVTSAERKQQVLTKIATIKQEIKKVAKDAILGSLGDISNDTLESKIDEANEWFQGFAEFWAGKDGTIQRIEDGTWKNLKSTNSKLYLAKESSIENVDDITDSEASSAAKKTEEYFQRVYDEETSGFIFRHPILEDDIRRIEEEKQDDGLFSNELPLNVVVRGGSNYQRLSVRQIQELYGMATYNSRGKIQLIFPKTKTGRDDSLPTIGSNREDHVSQANDVVREFDVFATLYITYDDPYSYSEFIHRQSFGALGKGSAEEFVSGIAIKDNEEVKQNFRANLRDSIEDHLTAQGKLFNDPLEGDGLGPSDGKGLAYNLFKIKDEISNKIEQLIDEEIDEILNTNLYQQLLQESSRDSRAKLIFNKLQNRLRVVSNETISSAGYTAFLATPHPGSGKDYPGSDIISKQAYPQAKLIKTSDTDNKGIIYGKYPKLQQKFSYASYANGGSLWYHKIDLSGGMVEAIKDGFLSERTQIENLIENALEEAVGYEAVIYDTRLFDRLAETDIIIQKSGYFFFDYEKFVRRRSFLSRYMDVGRLIDFTSTGKELTNAGIKIDKVTLTNLTHNLTMQLDREIQTYGAEPQDPVEYKNFKFITSLDSNGNLKAFPKAPISKAITFDQFFNYDETTAVATISTGAPPAGSSLVPGDYGTITPSAEGTVVAEFDTELSTVDTFSKITQRNFNFTGFNDGLLREGQTWKDDYRLNMYQYQFFIDDDQYNIIPSTIVPDDFPNNPVPIEGYTTDYQVYRIRIVDDSYESLVAITSKFQQLYNNFKRNYYDVALEQCSYNEFNKMFNDFFIDAIKEKYPNTLNPWSQMVSAYVLYLNMFTNSFQGDYVQMVEFGEKMLSSIRPETGTLDRLISVNTVFANFNEQLVSLVSAASIDSKTYSRVQTIEVQQAIQRPILDHIGDYSEVLGPTG